MIFARNKFLRTTFVASLLLLIVLSTSSCGPRRTPDLHRIFQVAREEKTKRPLIIIPGILGSELINKKTGEKVWPSAFRSSGDGLALPISAELSANRDDLIPGKMVETLKLSRLVPEVYIYHHLVKALREYAGYSHGEWNSPPSDGDQNTFYVFSYDWRLDNVENARELIRRIEQLKLALGKPDLKFNILAHSMGGLIARYAAMYGDADLPSETETLKASWAGAAHINRIFMFGTPNEGAAEAFATLLDGYSITEGLRRRVRLLNTLSREEAVTSPAMFQLLPHSYAVRFLDGDLKSLKIDLYDAETWRRYGWSPLVEAQFRRRVIAEIAHGSNANRRNEGVVDDYLQAVLSRARRFHEALYAVNLFESPVRFYVFGGDCEETLDAPLLIRDEKRNRWMTLLRPRQLTGLKGKKWRKAEVLAAMYAPGDGRVTRRSLMAETVAERRQLRPPFNSGLPLAYAVFACDLHGDLQNNKTLQDNALTVLLGEALK